MIVAVLLAAGRGERFGEDKTQVLLRGKPVWRWSCETYLAHPNVDGVLVVGSDSNLSAIQSASPEAIGHVLGGATRQESCARALAALPEGAEIVLVHDAARPFVSPSTISDVIRGVRAAGAAVPAVRVTDTIKEVRDDRLVTLDRSRLVAVQTPQGAKVELLRQAHAEATGEATDEMALLEAIGVRPEVVPGEFKNFKITTPEDLGRARALVGSGEHRTGLGYDIHPFADDADRPMWLGGVLFEGGFGLVGHSDADALAHAIVDAILGAVGLGDIGRHFSNTDPHWHGEPSSTFLRHAASLVRAEGWEIQHIDATVIAERPKISPRVEEMKVAMADGLGIRPDQVSLKATTNEKLGALGRSEGLAAFAVANLVR